MLNFSDSIAEFFLPFLSAGSPFFPIHSFICRRQSSLSLSLSSSQSINFVDIISVVLLFQRKYSETMHDLWLVSPIEFSTFPTCDFCPKWRTQCNASFRCRKKIEQPAHCSKRLHWRLFSVTKSVFYMCVEMIFYASSFRWQKSNRAANHLACMVSLEIHDIQFIVGIHDTNNVIIHH